MRLPWGQSKLWDIVAHLPLTFAPFNMKSYFSLILLFLTSVGLQAQKPASVRTVYGYNIEEGRLRRMAIDSLGAQMAAEPILHPAHRLNIRSTERLYHDQSLDFLLVIVLLLCVGFFKLVNPAYLRNLFRAFRNPTLTTRQLKEQLRQDSPASVAMDVIFSYSMGLYVYYLVRHIHRQQLLGGYPALVVVAALVLLFAVVYLARFLFLRFTGWVFRIADITDTYAFNVSLINKVLGILVIPFTAVLAFSRGQWPQTGMLLSFLLIAILFANRYMRSAIVFRYFIKFSRFHFFMYLCASELLPVAILIKVVNHWLVA
ncbi:MAG: DUF4271 domain-containing protein [Edaphocola sp.]